MPSEEPVAAEVFISYAGSDGEIASHLADDLARAGINVWFDRKIRPGDNWQDQINRHIEDAEAVVVVISPESLRSQWVRHEWTSALARSLRGGPGSRRIIPI